MLFRYRAVLPATAALAGSAASAATADVSVTLPQLKVAEYHRPYVAMWLEPVGGAGAAKTVQVWYQQPRANERESGTKWLADLRGWWRKAGRTMTVPAAGLTGATRTPGVQKASVDVGQLPPGQYLFKVEAAREDGGRELVSVPVTWTGKAARPATGAGATELGAVSIALK